MATNSAPNSPNKRIKTLSPDSKIFTVVEQEMDGSDSMNRSCGICLCDDRNAIRGKIDSCDHYFCFICIMEWAKIESRCPMCKRRFSAICRPQKDSVFPSERVVNIPKRDQVSLLSGNTTMEHFDPYAQVECSVCHAASDECLLLLCDLCDSAAHTYCVGLGVTVPQGDWFCHDCTVSRNEHENIQKDDDIHENLHVKCEVMLTSEPYVSTSDFGVNSHSTSDIYNETTKSEVNVSIFDIVCESDNSSIGRPRARFSLGPSTSRGPSNLACDAAQPRERTSQISQGQLMPQSDARTLTRCRNVHGNIRALRENWDALRSGFLRFSSSSVESSNRSIVKCRTLAVTEDSLNQSHVPCSTAGQQLTTDCVSPGICSQDVSRDAEKAWKMMAKAKSIQQACRKTRSDPCVSKISSRTGNAAGGSANVHLSRSQQVGTSRLGHLKSEKQSKLYSPEKQNEKNISPNLKLKSNGINMTKEIVRSSDNIPATSGVSTCITSWNLQTSTRRNSSLQIQQLASQQNVCRNSLKVADQRNVSGCSMDLVGPVSASSRSLKAKADLNVSFSQKLGDVRSGKRCTDRQARNDGNAKAEIQSLVKLNLKLLKGVEKIGADAFKEVARLATHTILAAGGFEHSRHVVNTFPSSVCSHSESIQRLHKSPLMPNCCRECFYAFVKEVVNSVLTDKLFHASSSKVIS